MVAYDILQNHGLYIYGNILIYSNNKQARQAILEAI